MARKGEKGTQKLFNLQDNKRGGEGPSGRGRGDLTPSITPKN